MGYRLPSIILYHFGSRLITAAASQGFAAGSLLADRTEASPAHRSAEPEHRSTVNTRASVRSGTAPCLQTAACLERGQRRQTDSADRRRTNYTQIRF